MTRAMPAAARRTRRGVQASEEAGTTQGSSPGAVDVQAYRQTLTEAELQKAIVDLAKTLGFRTYHTTFALASDRGFPDLLCIKSPRVIVAEVKGPRGKLRPGQQEWLDLFAACGVEAYLWTVDAWFDGTIERILVRGSES